VTGADGAATVAAEQLLPWVGLLTQAVLASLFAIAWRALRRRWALLLALGFAANTAMYAAMLAGTVQVALAGRPSTPIALLSVLAVVLITSAVIDYVNMGAAWARRLTATSIGVALLAVALGVAGHLPRGVGLGVLALYVVSWAVLFVRAVRLEPHSGHGLVILALLAYPATWAASVLGWVRPELLSGIGVLPFSVLGTTLLTTGLLRAHRQAALALDEREHAQAQLRAANESLEHRVAQRTAELRENVEGLESFNRSVSHDLRTPLGGIVGVARLGREALAAGDAARARSMLDLIESQAVISVKLVEALLALARASDAPMEMRPVDTGPLVHGVVETLAAPSQAAQVAVAPEMPTVQADADLLRQVFANLIGNALKFATPTGQPRVDVGTDQMDGETVFFVRDNGVGFEPDAARHLFKPFLRLHGRSYDGFGVGLSIVKRIVDRHGGRVWAEGRPGQGASFYFTLG
jgi:signal transduction histidine kinase